MRVKFFIKKIECHPADKSTRMLADTFALNKIIELMKNHRNLLLLMCVLFGFMGAACSQSKTSQPAKTSAENHPKNPYYSRTETQKLVLPDSIWKKILPEDLYAVSRQAETERAFTGEYWQTDVKGTYYCAACGRKLFRSDTKFQSSCGWPSFFEQSDKNSIVFKSDNSFGMQRIEALCGRCGGHLGHLFDDGPEPTGKRYCMNSIALDFEPDTQK